MEAIIIILLLSVAAKSIIYSNRKLIAESKAINKLKVKKINKETEDCTNHQKNEKLMLNNRSKRLKHKNLKYKNTCIKIKDEGKKRNQVERRGKLKLSPQMAQAKKTCFKMGNIENRILNGTTPGRNALPWIIAIFIKEIRLDSYNDTVFVCGGAIISTNFVLTAAHCIPPIYLNATVKDYSMFIVRYGMHDLSSKLFSKSGVTQIFIHPEYNTRPSSFSDIALIKLKKTIKYSDEVRPICVPRLTTPSLWDDLKVKGSGTPVLVSGWGTRSSAIFMPSFSLTLQKGYAVIEDGSVCAKLLSKWHNQSTTLCLSKNASQVCYGDSGSPVVPLVFMPGNDSFVFPVVLGVVSFGLGGCQGPSVSTKVESFIDWINEITFK